MNLNNKDMFFSAKSIQKNGHTFKPFTFLTYLSKAQWIGLYIKKTMDSLYKIIKRVHSLGWSVVYHLYRLTCRWCRQSRQGGRSCPGQWPLPPPQSPHSHCSGCRACVGSPACTDSLHSSWRTPPGRGHSHTLYGTHISAVWVRSLNAMPIQDNRNSIQPPSHPTLPHINGFVHTC